MLPAYHADAGSEGWLEQRMDQFSCTKCENDQNYRRIENQGSVETVRNEDCSDPCRVARDKPARQRAIAAAVQFRNS